MLFNLNVSFDPNDIGRAYRIGLSYTDNQSGKKVKSIVVKFGSWKARQLFYKIRPRYHTDGSKKPRFSVSVGLTKRRYLLLSKANPVGNHMFKVNNRNTKARCEIFSKLTIKRPERRHWRRSDVFIVNFEHISHLVLVLLLIVLLLLLFSHLVLLLLF